MFHNENKVNGIIVYIVLVSIIITLICLYFIQDMSDENGSITSIPDNIAYQQTGSNAAADNSVDSSENSQSAQNNSTLYPVQSNNAFSSYYMIIHENGNVNIYYYPTADTRELVRTTEVPFELLSETDRNMLNEGIKITDKDTLNEFLQDYES